jgi:hypothetical protein
MVLVRADNLSSFFFIQVLILLMIGLITHQLLFFQEPFVNIPDDKIREALKVVLGTAPFYFFKDEESITFLLRTNRDAHSHLHFL